MPAREVDLKLVGGRVVTGGGVLQAGVAVDGARIVAVAPTTCSRRPAND